VHSKDIIEQDGPHFRTTKDSLSLLQQRILSDLFYFPLLPLSTAELSERIK
jgi:hypothetical protein